MAGASITGVATKHYDVIGVLKFIKVVLTCVADDGTNLFPATVINSLVDDYDAGIKLEGLYLLTVGSTPGSPAPTDGTDLELLQDSVDMLNAKGSNLIDSTTSEITWAGSSGQDFGMPVCGDITTGISGNSVASAATTLVLIFAV